MASPTFALPGQLIGPVSAHIPGPGTHVYAANLYASIAGNILSTPAPKKPSKSAPASASLPTASIIPATRARLPEVGAVVLGKITRTTPTNARLEILCLVTPPKNSTSEPEYHVCPEPFQASIRQQDIRATEIDKVKVHESFRVGDVVKARIVGLGDERSYFASTAGNEYGVVVAWAGVESGGGVMVPGSWKEVVEVGTGKREARKVAKPV